MAMLCKNGEEKDIDNLNWIGSRKYDGVRLIAICNSGGVRLLGRSGAEYTKKLPDVVNALKGFIGILDGEIICGDEFGFTQSRILTDNKLKQKLLQQKYPAKYYVFDILNDGEDLKDKPLSDRINRLNEVLEDNNIITKVENFTNLHSLLDEAKMENWEGIVVKNPSSKYIGKRSDNWKKIKLKKSKDIVFTQYEINPAGVRVESNDGIAIQVSGYNSKQVKEEIDNNGESLIEVEYLNEFESGKLRMPVFKEIKK